MRNEKILKDHITLHKSNAIDFVVQYAETEWAKEAKKLYEDLIEIAEDGKDNKQARSVAGMIMKRPENERKAILIHTFGLKEGKIKACTNDESKLAKELATLKKVYLVNTTTSNRNGTQHTEDGFIFAPYFNSKGKPKEGHNYFHPLFIAQLKVYRDKVKK